MRKSHWTFGSVVTVMSALCMFLGSHALAQVELKIPAASPTSLSSLVENTAIYKGFFKDIGYDAKIYSVSGGESAAVLALEKGQLPVFGTDDNIPLAIRPKSNIKVVGIGVGKLLYFLAAGPAVKSFKDLPKNNIRIGISSPTSSNVFVSLSLLEKNGINIKTARLIKVGGSNARLAAVKAGKVDVGSLTLGPMLKAKDSGLSILGSGGQIYDNFAFIQFGMNQNWVKEHRQKAVEILGTLIRACHYVNNNREGTIEVLNKQMENPMERATQMYDIGVKQEQVVPSLCQISKDGIEAYIESAKWAKAIPESMKVPPIEEITMPDLYEEALAWFKKKEGM